mmetsp:Transcript_77846/g.176037  ORF Transcript_77846/g.176037 Transcript_77846/m.176037 type:complete len:216 (+) Transcript_77846:51-698(+)
MAINPILAQDETSGSLFPLPQSGEAFVLTRDGIDFECRLPRGGKLSGSGCFYLSSKRIVFVATKVSGRSDFKSFEVPLVSLREQSFEQPIFGANYLAGKTGAADEAPQEIAALFDGQLASFSLTFNHGGCGTFLPLFFQLLSEAQENLRGSAVASAAQEGRLDQVAYVDPSDPSVLFLSQPRAAPNSQERTDFHADQASSGGSGRHDEPSSCTCS